MGRPRIYATPAERQKAYRSRGVVKSFRTEAKTAATIEELAATFDVSENEVLNSLVKFALLNRQWFTLGIIRYRNKEETAP